MRSLLFCTVLAVAVTTGCAKKNTDAAASAERAVATVSIDQLDTQLAKHECIPVDANGQQTRKKLGVIPGAVLLTDSETFTASELPTDKAKALVFYCANTSCGASEEAARKAIAAGFTNVKVLPDGIAGWVKAGKQVQNI